MTFPTAHSQIYRNEEGEVLGWDAGPSPEPEYFDCCGWYGRCVCDEGDEEDEDPPPPTDSWCEACESMNCTCY